MKSDDRALPPAEDHATHASHQAPTGLGHPVGIVSAVYVVSRSTGEYSDRREEPILALTTKEDAKLFCTLAAEQFRTAINLHPVPPYPDQTEVDWAQREIALVARAEAARRIATLDPEAIEEDGWEDTPYYYYREVPLRSAVNAQGTEARSAETAGLSPQGDGPVPVGNAPITGSQGEG